VIAIETSLALRLMLRRIVGWRVSRNAWADFMLDTLEQALHARQPVKGGLIHHSGRRSQYVSIRYGDRLVEADIEPSVGSVGDCYDHALAETVNGLYKAEGIHRRSFWKNIEAVERTTLAWIDWLFNRMPGVKGCSTTDRKLRGGMVSCWQGT
jgi:putative transposase